MSKLPRMAAMPIIQFQAPFDDPDFIFEVKFDGYRALAYVEDGSCELVSRKGHSYTRFANLRTSIAADLKAKSAILDGEIVCLDGQGRSQFYHLMFNRSEPYLYAFDLLWLDGVDLRELPLLERKKKLKKVIPASSRLLYLDHIARRGVSLFEMACERDLEGIVAKLKESLYQEVGGKTPWVKIKNPEYSQAEGRVELFNRRRR